MRIPFDFVHPYIAYEELSSRICFPPTSRGHPPDRVARYPLRLIELRKLQQRRIKQKVCTRKQLKVEKVVLTTHYRTTSENYDL